MRPSSARNSRAGGSRRSRSTRPVKRARGKSRPLLTPRQAREVAGVLLLLFGIMGVIALLLSSSGSALAGLRTFWSLTFGLAWPLPVGVALAAGGYLLLPNPPALRRLDLLAGLLAAVASPAMRVVAEPEDEPPEIDWKLPPITLLDTVTARKERMQDEIKRNVRVIESTLATFGVQARVIGVNPGPAVTQYELQPADGVQVKRITTLQNDLSLALAAAPLRI